MPRPAARLVWVATLLGACGGETLAPTPSVDVDTEVGSVSSAIAQPIDGTLESSAPGMRSRMRSAFAITYGGRAVAVLASSTMRDCAWAIAGGVGEIRPREANISLWLAPVLDAALDVPHWTAISAWVRSVDEESSNAFDIAWPVEVRPGPICPERIAFDVAGRGLGGELAITADFTPTCCPVDVPTPASTMTLELGSHRFVLGRGWWRQLERGGFSLRLSRMLEPCDWTTTHEDVFVDVGPVPRSLSSTSPPLTMTAYGTLRFVVQWGAIGDIVRSIGLRRRRPVC